MTNHTDTHLLYVLLVSLLGTVIVLPAVWYSPKPLTLLLVSLPNDLLEELTWAKALRLPPIIIARLRSIDHGEMRRLQPVRYAHGKWPTSRGASLQSKN